MALDDQHTEVNPPPPPPPQDPPTRHPPFVEVICTSSGKTRRFVAGTEASFAVSVINSKLEGGPRVWHIEAAKEGQEPITFGPNSILVDYGNGWHLQTVSEPEGFGKKGAPFVRSSLAAFPIARDPNVSPPVKPTTVQSNISFSHIAKILLAFVLIFAMGAALTFALENLPRLILYINSSL